MIPVKGPSTIAITTAKRKMAIRISSRVNPCFLTRRVPLSVEFTGNYDPCLPLVGELTVPGGVIVEGFAG